MPEHIERSPSDRGRVGSPAGALNLRAGEWVEVRSRDEILSTLDASGRLQGMCFMPEMFAYCGQRLRVYKSAHKTCDTVTVSGGRRVADTVHLDDIRCDGSAHGGCEAACLIFWKEHWLKRVPPAAVAVVGAPASARSRAEQTVWAAVRVDAGGPGDEPIYSCQATRLLEATSPLPWWDLRQYWEDYRSGNVDVRTVMTGFAYSVSSKVVGAARRLGSRLGIDLASPAVKAYDAVQRVWGGRAFPRKTGTIPKGQRTPERRLNLHPGELIRVRSHAEILETLDTDSKNRGLYFDAEHVPYCNGTYRVRSLVSRIIDERTGKMLNFKTPSVILDGVYCRAKYSYDRMFCPRAIYSYWRDIWLDRVADGPADAAPIQAHDGRADGTEALPSDPEDVPPISTHHHSRVRDVGPRARDDRS